MQLSRHASSAPTCCKLVQRQASPSISPSSRRSHVLPADKSAKSAPSQIEQQPSQQDKNNRPLAPRSHVWITDSVLDQAWNQFLRSGISHKPSPSRTALPRTTLLQPEALHSRTIQCAGQGLSRARLRSCTYDARQIRHGSNVPGPLEANRRLAKRKNTAFALHGAGSLTDFGALFGAGRSSTSGNGDFGNLRYERPSSVVEAQPDMNKSKPEPLAESDANVLELPGFDGSWDGHVGTQQDSSLAGGAFGGGGKKFEDRLRYCHGCNDVHALLQEVESEIDHSTDEVVTRSKQIIDFFVETPGEGLKDLEEALDDPILNVPEAQNFLGILNSMSDRRQNLSFWLTLFSAMQKRLTVGLVSIDELTLVFEHLSQLRKSNELPGRHFGRSTFLRCNRMILDGISSCTIITPKDLGGQFFDNWLAELLDLMEFPDACRLAEDIFHIMPSSTDAQIEYTSLFLVLWVSKLPDLDPETIRPAPSVTSTSTSGVDAALLSIRRVLRALPEERALTVAFDVLRKLIVSARAKPKYLPRFKFWSEVLNGCFDESTRQQRLQILLDPKLWQDPKAPSIEFLAANFWLLGSTAFNQSSDEFVEEFGWYVVPEFKERLRQVYSEQGQRRKAVAYAYARFAMDMEKLPPEIREPILHDLGHADIPRTIVAFHECSYEFRGMEAVAAKRAIATTLDVLDPKVQAVLVEGFLDSQWFSVMRWVFRNHVILRRRLFLCNFAIRMKAQRRRLLRKSDILDYYQENECKHHRNGTWRSREEWYPQEHEKEVIKNLDTEVLPYMHFILFLAQTTAHSPNLSGAGAHKRVRWCWQFLSAHSILPSKEIVTSMYHASVTRPKETRSGPRPGPADAQWEWVLTVVEKVGGPELVKKVLDAEFGEYNELEEEMDELEEEELALRAITPWTLLAKERIFDETEDEPVAGL